MKLLLLRDRLAENGAGELSSNAFTAERAALRLRHRLVL